MFPTLQEINNLKNWIKKNPHGDWRIAEEYKVIYEKLKDNHREQIEKYRETDFIKAIQIIAAGDTSCDVCRAWNKKIVPLNQAENILPFNLCQNKKYGYCRCTTIPYF